jgi:DNA polymerase elongation subunit (family B)
MFCSAPTDVTDGALDAHTEKELADFQSRSRHHICYFVQPKRGSFPRDEAHRPGRGIVPLILIDLLRERGRYKDEMEEEKDPFRKSILNGLQLSYKITANSLYGQMGASTSPIRCEMVASSITATGRTLLLTSRKTILAHKPGSSVIYGDTDSLFVLYPTSGTAVEKRQQAMQCAKDVETIMAQLLPWPHCLSYEKVYDPFLIFTKKRYAALMYDKSPEKVKKMDTKGLQDRRRDIAPIVQKVFQSLLRNVLTHKGEEAVDLIRGQVNDLLMGKVPFESLIVSKSLKKSYKVPPCHKILADRMLERDPGSAPQVGDRVPYVFVEKRVVSAEAAEHRVMKERKSSQSCKPSIFERAKQASQASQASQKQASQTSQKQASQTSQKQASQTSQKQASQTSQKHTSKSGKTDEPPLKLVKRTAKPNQGDMVEHPSYVQQHKLRVDYVHYVERQLLNPTKEVLKLFHAENALDDLIATAKRKQQNIPDIASFFKRTKLP